MRATLHKLVTAKGYPAAIQGAGLRSDAGDARPGGRSRQRQHLQDGPLRLSRARAPRAVGRSIARSVGELYQRERMRLSNQRYAWIDTLFALPEAVLYAGLVDYFDRHDAPGKPDYAKLWEDIRECIDVAHRDESLKAIVSARPARLHRARRRRWPTRCTSSARRGRGCSCSPTRPGTTPTGDELPARRRAPALPVVAQLLRHHRRRRRQAGVLHRGAPVRRAGRRRRAGGEAVGDGPFQRGRVYSGGNVIAFEDARARARRAGALRRRPHLRRHAAQSRKSSKWRTAMVLQELEHEITMYDRLRPELARLDRLDAELIHLDAS